jgi:hypothetical protein
MPSQPISRLLFLLIYSALLVACFPEPQDLSCDGLNFLKPQTAPEPGTSRPGEPRRSGSRGGPSGGRNADPGPLQVPPRREPFNGQTKCYDTCRRIEGEEHHPENPFMPSRFCAAWCSLVPWGKGVEEWETCYDKCILRAGKGRPTVRKTCVKECVRVLNGIPVSI